MASAAQEPRLAPSGKWWAAVTLVQDLHALELVGWPAKLGPRGHFRPSKGGGGGSQNVDLAAYPVNKIPLKDAATKESEIGPADKRTGSRHAYVDETGKGQPAASLTRTPYCKPARHINLHGMHGPRGARALPPRPADPPPQIKYHVTPARTEAEAGSRGGSMSGRRSTTIPGYCRDEYVATAGHW